MKARILYVSWERTTVDDRFHAGRDGHVLPEEKLDDIGTFDVDPATDIEALEKLFERFNIGDHGGLRVRSLSVGDVVELDGRRYVCAPCGWDRVGGTPDGTCEECGKEISDADTRFYQEEGGEGAPAVCYDCAERCAL